MKKLGIVVVTLLVAGYLGWQNRVDILVWGAPKLTLLMNPVLPNVPTQWTQGPAAAALPANDRQPNIILILVDDMGFNDISLYNGGAADGSLQTPNIDSLAMQGVTFDNGYAANAICAPSRASLLTGRYSTRFGFEFTPMPKVGPRIFQWMEDLNPSVLPVDIDMFAAAELPSMQEQGVPSEEITIAETLKEAGYYTAHIGKWHIGAAKGMRPEDQGFDDSLYMSGVLYLPEDDARVVNAKVEDQIDKMVWAFGEYSAQFNGGPKFEPNGYLTDYYTDEAVKVIDANRHQPFFLYLAQWGVHNPLQAKREDYAALAHIQDPKLRVYAAMIRALDRSVAQITEALERNGIADNTLIVFTSDNGGAGYIGLADVNKPYRGWKLTHFEGGTHVPYMAKWPAKIAAGTEMKAPIHHIDLFHTFAAAAGAVIPSDRRLDGVNLLPFIRKEVQGNPHETLFWRQGHQQTVLHQGWKMIRADRPDKRWLFNLAADPTEQNNLAAANPQQVAVLEGLLAAHNAEQIEPLWPSVLDGAQLIDKDGSKIYEDGDEYIYWPN